MKKYNFENAVTAVRFLTVFTLGKHSADGELTREKAKAALPFFPVAGLVAGAVSAAVVIVLSPLAESRLVCAVFAVAALAVATRGLHIDAVADCFDALHFFGNREKALAVMKDKSVGAFGAAGVAFVVASKIFALGSVPHEAFIGALLAVPAVSRFAPAVVSYLSTGVSENPRNGGLGALFNFGGDRAIVAKAAVPAFLIPLLLCGFGGIAVALLVSAMAVLLAVFFKSAFGTPNGDVHGAATEICELFGFIAAGALL